ncbi:hypothetical protein R3W88_000009 [Solanum pinnatisectum]|uniref:Receptor-like serine/threonine-protein kinase n=1 Tax=Solanum pinnatisectum TaxID=50273 RepID=A0AAV9ME56_9SOLN|nr:hypothetical protein R3W88_000009 [Solanum pinnatisectum]
MITSLKYLLVLHFFYLGLCLSICDINSTQYLKDPATLWCPDNIFKLGFFSPGNTTNRYVGIWYNFSETTVVWVANRDKPLKDSFGVFKISEDGNLVLRGGNLVLLDNSKNRNIIWQSYQHPSDTFLPRMKIPINSVKTGEKTGQRSWKSPLDPGFGDFSTSITAILPQLLIWRGKNLYWRSGQWNGQVFIGIKSMRSVHTGGYNVVDDEEGTVYLTGLVERKEPTRFVLDSSENLVQSYWDAIENDCDVYRTCGPFGSCNSLGSPICSCLRGFEPKNINEWGKEIWTSGCVWRKNGFLKMGYMKVPDFAEWLLPKLEDECRSQWLSNCSFLAYAFDTGIGCMSWSGFLIDILQFQASGMTLHIRVSHSELDHHGEIRLIATLVIVSSFVVCVDVSYMVLDVKAKRSVWEKLLVMLVWMSFQFSSLKCLAMSTNQFHDNNKLGQGGFGPVYKVNLFLSSSEPIRFNSSSCKCNCQVVSFTCLLFVGSISRQGGNSCKRLSTASGQGMEEFMNEVLLIARVQHRNLVRLLGCCIEKEEKMLIYEYLPNKSLDVFLFDQMHKGMLDSSKRLHIIEGIGRRLLYLHRDSRIKIIHRDLKPSNILLDNDFNPKISDFGMARFFKCNQDQAETRKVAGTYGYMAPEYAIKGTFSEKSDVFSFGVLLEIMSGQKAWELLKENDLSNFIDQMIWDPNFEIVLTKCIQIGLLCVQEFARDRATISNVLSMFSSDVISLPTPLKPAFANFYDDNGVWFCKLSHFDKP